MARHKPTRFDSTHDIPSLEGKVILITGGNAGLGRQAVLDFARHKPSQIWIASRSLEKANLTAQEIRSQLSDTPILRPLELDLSSFESVKSAAQEFLSESNRLDILMLNAGIMATSTGLTKEGYEIQFGTNHMGHALLARLLLPALTATARNVEHADVRIVSVASRGHAFVPDGGFRFDMLRSEAAELGPYGRYQQSKLANVLWARQMAKLHPQITVTSVHPGLVQTQLMDGATGNPIYVKLLVKLGYRLLKTVDEGVKNQLWAAVAKDIKSGEYYEPVGLMGQASADGRDDALAKKTWDWTDKELSSWLSQTRQ